MDAMLSRIPDWLNFIRWILWPIIGITVSLISGYIFTSVALIIASPFNALLAEKAEELITGQAVNSLEGLGAAFLAVPRSIVRELLKLLYYVPMALLVLVISFVPGVGAVAWLLLGAWMMSIQFVDYPMDNHQLSFTQVKAAVRSRATDQHGVWRRGRLVRQHTVGEFFCGARCSCGRHSAMVRRARSIALWGDVYIPASCPITLPDLAIKTHRLRWQN